jgi:hypothetical protein
MALVGSLLAAVKMLDKGALGKLTAAQYCEWIVYTTRNNLDGPGITNQAPAVTDHCTRVTSKDGRITFAPPGEGVESSFDEDDFTAIIPGQFVDHWRRVR